MNLHLKKTKRQVMKSERKGFHCINMAHSKRFLLPSVAITLDKSKPIRSRKLQFQKITQRKLENYNESSITCVVSC